MATEQRNYLKICTRSIIKHKFRLNKFKQFEIDHYRSAWQRSYPPLDWRNSKVRPVGRRFPPIQPRHWIPTFAPKCSWIVPLGTVSSRILPQLRGCATETGSIAWISEHEMHLKVGDRLCQKWSEFAECRY